MNETIIVTLVGFLASLSSIIFAFLAFKRSERQEHKKEGKNEGLIISDIGYIKACVDRMEKNFNKLDERYNQVLERLSKAEESLYNVAKRVDELNKLVRK